MRGSTSPPHVLDGAAARTATLNEAERFCRSLLERRVAAQQVVVQLRRFGDLLADEHRALVGRQFVAETLTERTRLAGGLLVLLTHLLQLIASDVVRELVQSLDGGSLRGERLPVEISDFAGHPATAHGGEHASCNETSIVM